VRIPARRRATSRADRRPLASGLRISEALELSESDLDPRRGAIVVRHGKGDKRREIRMDTWAWEHYSDALVMPTVG
jgi:site-specific recombinase XerD